MTLILGEQELAGALEMSTAIDLIEEVLLHEAAGQTMVTPRQTTKTERGWMRWMYAADYLAGYAATKAFHLTRGAGVRYLVSLYRTDDGELLSILDGREITDLRTGAASGVAARYLAPAGSRSVGILGAGHQARSQLEALHAILPIILAKVYSPTKDHRCHFAEEMSDRLGIRVLPVDSPEEALYNQPLVVLATNSTSTDPVLQSTWLAEDVLVCAVGSTRQECVELDIPTLEGARLVVVDTLNAVEEAGDLNRALDSGSLKVDALLTLAELVHSGKERTPGVTVFKSVGTALQDLAMAVSYYEIFAADGRGQIVHGLASLKQPVSAHRNFLKRSSQE